MYHLQVGRWSTHYGLWIPAGTEWVRLVYRNKYATQNEVTIVLENCWRPSGPRIICTNAEQTPTNDNSNIINDTRLVRMLSISIQYIHKNWRKIRSYTGHHNLHRNAIVCSCLIVWYHSFTFRDIKPEWLWKPSINDIYGSQFLSSACVPVHFVLSFAVMRSIVNMCDSKLPCGFLLQSVRKPNGKTLA